MTVYIGYKSSATTVIFSLASRSLICYKQNNLNSSLNIPYTELNLLEDHNELNKNVHFDMDKVKDICQKRNK